MFDKQILAFYSELSWDQWGKTKVFAIQLKVKNFTEMKNCSKLHVCPRYLQGRNDKEWKCRAEKTQQHDVTAERTERHDVIAERTEQYDVTAERTEQPDVTAELTEQHDVIVELAEQHDVIAERTQQYYGTDKRTEQYDVIAEKTKQHDDIAEDHRHNDCRRTFANTNALNVNDDGIAFLEETNHKQQRHASVQSAHAAQPRHSGLVYDRVLANYGMGNCGASV